MDMMPLDHSPFLLSIFFTAAIWLRLLSFHSSLSYRQRVFHIVTVVLHYQLFYQIDKISLSL
ncbi:hypothetical protein M431DRAFT_365771 [Trichoderma harzianum CBS 226.95]|uniref:Uncharacterized protein n=1 Tax=Trichoderma harzianum CBS 226.95 TaxID=983964 RepID=A0A2T3ZSZ5_TRIHA|nr:hypothetical protein M431DRAFT_365771 [Trichoderma harzianum CBS 226.95]PTB47915.1 hypothetical protein M431DRAFT_365771 [Trichoderma harzianum CBS 226.95]